MLYINQLGIIRIYTDASTHHQTQQGAWAALIHHNNETIILKKLVKNTTNNRLELWAVLQAINYIKVQNMPYNEIHIHTDSQYVIGITRRKDRLQANDFYTKKGTLLPNVDLFKMMINYIETEPLKFIKIKAHLKKADANPHHRKVDKLVRKMLRTAIR